MQARSNFIKYATGLLSLRNLGRQPITTLKLMKLPTSGLLNAGSVVFLMGMQKA